MKIAYTISGLYNSGGMENILLQKANYLADKYKHEVTIITTDQDNRPIFFRKSSNVNHIDLNINYYKYKSNRLWHFHKQILKRKHRRSLEHLLHASKFDIVISFMDFDFGFLYSINDGSKKLIEYHFSKYYKVIEASNVFKRIFQRIRICLWGNTINKYDKFIVLTEEDKKQWSKINNIAVIPNFVTIVRHTTNTEFNNKTVISVGRFSYQKGFDLLLKSWIDVSKEFPDWKLMIVGGGNQSMYKLEAKKLGIESSVIFKGPTNNIAEEFQKSSLYVMSSRYEGFPLVLLEALSSGLPVISFSCPCGPRDVIKSDFGSLVPCYDIKGLSKAMIEWIGNEDKRIKGCKIAKQVSEDFVIDKVMVKWDNLLKSLVNKS